MTIPRFHHSVGRFSLPLAAVLSLFTAGAARGQESGRIWGRVGTVDGEIHEGFIRWDRNEASWADVLDGSKPLVWEEVREWLPDSALDVRSRDRVIEYGGYRITWDDAEADFPLNAESGIRFGYIQRIQITGDQDVEISLRSGESLTINEDSRILHPSPGVTVIMEGGSTDLGTDLRELLIDVPGREVVELEWEDLSWVDFGPAPAGARPRSDRLFGTVENRRGARFTGPISWDNDEALATDVLDGEDESGRDREIPFRRIASVRPERDGARVTLVDGEDLFLSGSNDVDDDNRGIQISDLGLGRVEVEWDDLEEVRFHPPDAEAEQAMRHDAFGEIRRMRGTVVTVTGEELTGWIRWDADEEFSWELLDGSDRAATYDVELGKITSIEPLSSQESRVTLLDGRVLEMRGSNDVDDDNKGILVRTEELEAADDPEGPQWIRVRWDDLQLLRFHR